MAKHLIKKWKGTRASYNFLLGSAFMDPWTEYNVVETNGTIVRYLGTNIINIPTGQLIPVKDVVSKEPNAIDILPYDRYLVGTDATGYKVIQYTIDPNGEFCKEELDFDWRYGVRVMSRGLKNYVYYNGKLVSYDDVDAGAF